MIDRLLLVTDRKQAARSLAGILGDAFAAGCRWASLREKDLPAEEQVQLARDLLALARRFGARLTLHGDPNLAFAAGVDGVHLPAGGDVAAARAALGPDALIGISIHSVAEARVMDRTIDYACSVRSMRPRASPATVRHWKSKGSGSSSALHRYRSSRSAGSRRNASPMS